MRKTVDYTSAEITNNRNRRLLTILIVSSGIIMIGILAVIIISLAEPKDKLESAK